MNLRTWVKVWRFRCGSQKRIRWKREGARQVLWNEVPPLLRRGGIGFPLLIGPAAKGGRGEAETSLKGGKVVEMFWWRVAGRKEKLWLEPSSKKRKKMLGINSRVTSTPAFPKTFSSFSPVKSGNLRWNFTGGRTAAAAVCYKHRFSVVSCFLVRRRNFVMSCQQQRKEEVTTVPLSDQMH